MKPKCAKCDAYVRSKTTARERKCHLYAACHKGSDKYCWVHAFKMQPTLMQNLQQSVRTNDDLTTEQAGLLLADLKRVQTRLQQLQV